MIWCPPSFVCPSSYIVLLLGCSLLKQHVLWHKQMTVLSRDKQPWQQLHSKMGSGLIFEGGPIYSNTTLHLWAVKTYQEYQLWRLGVFGWKVEKRLLFSSVELIVHLQMEKRVHLIISNSEITRNG